MIVHILISMLALLANALIIICLMKKVQLEILHYFAKMAKIECGHVRETEEYSPQNIRHDERKSFKKNECRDSVEEDFREEEIFNRISKGSRPVVSFGQEIDE